MRTEDRRAWKDMTPGQKKQYFMDYYLGWVLIGIAAVLFGCWVVKTVLTPKPQYALRIGIYDTSLSEEEKSRAVYSVQKALGTAEAVEIDDTYTSLNDEDLLRIATLSEAGRLDVLIADEEVFSWLAGHGYFKDLRQACSEPFLEDYGMDLVMCRGLRVTEGGLLDEHSEGNGEPYAAGIRLGGETVREGLPDLKEPVLGILFESDCTGKIEELIRFLDPPQAPE